MTDQVFVHLVSAVILSLGAVKPSKIGELCLFGWPLDLTISTILVFALNWVLIDQFNLNSWLETGTIFFLSLALGPKVPLVTILSQFRPQKTVLTMLKDRNLTS